MSDTEFCCNSTKFDQILSSLSQPLPDRFSPKTLASPMFSTCPENLYTYTLDNLTNINLKSNLGDFDKISSSFGGDEGEEKKKKEGEEESPIEGAFLSPKEERIPIMDSIDLNASESLLNDKDVDILPLCYSRAFYEL